MGQERQPSPCCPSFNEGCSLIASRRTAISPSPLQAVLHEYVNTLLGVIHEPYTEASSAAGASLDGDLWASAMAQELHFFLSALPDHDDLPGKLCDILCGFLDKAKRDPRDSPGGPAAGDLGEAHRAAVLNLIGVCLGHLGNSQKASSTLELLLGHASSTAPELNRGAVRRAFARGLGMAASRHLELTLTAIAKVAKTDAATRRTGSLQSAWFGKSTAAQLAEQLRATLLLSLGFCAIHSPGPMLLQEKASEQILKPLHQALQNERTAGILRSAERVRVKLRCWPIGKNLCRKLLES
eukprot:s1072_g5.t1